MGSMLPFFQLSVDPVLSTIRYTYYISLPVVALFSSLSVSTFLCSYLSLSLSFFLSVFLIRLLGFSSGTFLGLVPLISFFCFFLFLFPLLFLFLFCCSLFPLWTFSSGRVSICCCSLRPRNLYLSGRKHRYGIWLYWMATSIHREERSI